MKNKKYNKVGFTLNKGLFDFLHGKLTQAAINIINYPKHKNLINLLISLIDGREITNSYKVNDFDAKFAKTIIDFRLENRTLLQWIAIILYYKINNGDALKNDLGVCTLINDLEICFNRYISDVNCEQGSINEKKKNIEDFLKWETKEEFDPAAYIFLLVWLNNKNDVNYAILQKFLLSFNSYDIDSYKRNALHYTITACNHGSQNKFLKGIIKPILDKNTTIIYKLDNDGCNILHYACGLHDNVNEIIFYIMDKHPKLVTQHDREGNTPLDIMICTWPYNIFKNSILSSRSNTWSNNKRIIKECENSLEELKNSKEKISLEISKYESDVEKYQKSLENGNFFKRFYYETLVSNCKGEIKKLKDSLKDINKIIINRNELQRHNDIESAKIAVKVMRDVKNRRLEISRYVEDSNKLFITMLSKMNIKKATILYGDLKIYDKIKEYEQQTLTFCSSSSKYLGLSKEKSIKTIIKPVEEYMNALFIPYVENSPSLKLLVGSGKEKVLDFKEKSIFIDEFCRIWFNKDIKNIQKGDIGRNFHTIFKELKASLNTLQNYEMEKELKSLELQNIKLNKIVTLISCYGTILISTIVPFYIFKEQLSLNDINFLYFLLFCALSCIFLVSFTMLVHLWFYDDIEFYNDKIRELDNKIEIEGQKYIFDVNDNKSEVNYYNNDNNQVLDDVEIVQAIKKGKEESNINSLELG